ncbi:MAG: leucyl aminopeptidase [Bradyrhizobiaceae bacterium]|nr:MAG: leucyl aminopeptidase [Bradyrhizobiaceae bacterium]
MADAPKLGFVPIAAPSKGVLVVFAGENLQFGARTRALLRPTGDLVPRVAKAERFTGKNATVLDILAPAGLKASRLIVVGTGKAGERRDLVRLGGATLGRLSPAARVATLVLELADGALKPEAAADVALGLALRAYAFDRYKTRRKDDEEAPGRIELSLAVADAAGARRAWSARRAVAEGVALARDLVNEPPNVLFPEEFARRAAKDLRGLGVRVEVLGERALRGLKMNALLAVGQGSDRESQVVVMRWNGGKAGEAPLAFVGKGVCFDTGGISIKPAAGMEDMKGDMAGAACVVGLMHALAARKAKVNAVGLVGLVENMPDGKAQRPGDIVTSMSGQTIEIINTDAEGRLVLGDVLHYAASRFKPELMVDLATLTGAILVALGQEHAGLFSNNDALAERLAKAGEATGEKVWRMPLGPEYDKLVDSKFADMKNTGGRNAGSITAAQFLQRFVGKTPWAHLDIAGTGMGSPQTDLNRSWGSGWGVRLLDRLVADYYET